MSWTEERIGLLKTLCDPNHPEKLSARALARRIGGGFTRSAIQGKVKRLGLTMPNAGKFGNPVKRGGRPKNVPSHLRATPISPKPKAYKFNPGFSSSNETGEEFKADPTPAKEIPEHEGAKHLSIVALEMNQCRWPTKSEGTKHLFCGDKAKGPYCDFHEGWNHNRN